MCDRWRNSFPNFLADMGGCPLGMSLERIDVNGDYEPGNCKWATDLEQANNKRNTIAVVHEGRRMSLRQFAVMTGVSYPALHVRVRYQGQDPHEAVECMRARLSVEYEGVKMTLSDFASLHGVSYKSLHSRIKRGQLTPQMAVARMLAKTATYRRKLTT